MFIAIASSTNAAFFDTSIARGYHQGLPPPMKPAIPLHSSSYHAVAGAFQSSGRAKIWKTFWVSANLRNFQTKLVGGFNPSENISQWDGLSHILWKIIHMFETTNQEKKYWHVFIN